MQTGELLVLPAEATESCQAKAQVHAKSHLLLSRFFEVKETRASWKQIGLLVGWKAAAHAFEAVLVPICGVHRRRELGFRYVEDENENILNSHTASTAEVFLGTPRYFNLGLTVRF